MSTEITFYDLPVVEVELPGYLHIGIPGGYYKVSLSQPSADVARFTFTPSRENMAEIAPVDIALPVGEKGEKGDKGDKGDTGDTGATFTPSVDEDGILSWENDKELENPESVDLKPLLEIAAQKDLEEIRQDIADLQYEPIAISHFKNSFGTSVGTVEIGTEVTEVTLSWATSKTPVSMTLDGEAVDIGEGSTLFNQALSYQAGEGITSYKKWELKAVDERGAEATDTTAIQFLNGVYYGALEYGAAIDSAAILSLSKKLQSGRAVNFTVSSKRPVYACPSNGYGTPTFKIGGFEYEWEKVSTFQFTNASGYTESYDVWMHGQDVSSSVTINVT